MQTRNVFHLWTDLRQILNILIRSMQKQNWSSSIRSNRPRPMHTCATLDQLGVRLLSSVYKKAVLSQRENHAMSL